MKSSYKAILAVLLAGCAMASAQQGPEGFLLSNFTVKASGSYVFKVVSKWSEAVTGLDKTDFQIEILKGGAIAETWSDGLNIESITSNPDGTSYVIKVDVSSLLAGAADDARVTLLANSVTTVAGGVAAPAQDLVGSLVMPNDDAATAVDDYYSMMGDTFQISDDATIQNDPYSLMDDQFEIPGQTDDDFVDEPPANFTGNLTEPTPSDATEPVDAHSQTDVVVSNAPPDSTEFSQTQPESDNVTFSDANAPTNDDVEDGAPPENATTEIPNDSTITSGTDAAPFGGNQTEPAPSDSFMATIPENETVTSGPVDDVNRPDDDGATAPADTFDDEATTLYDDAIPSNGPVMGGNETTEPEPEPSYIPAPSSSPMPEPSGSVPPLPSDNPVTSADDAHITTGYVVMGNDTTSGTDSPLKNDVPSTNPWDDQATGSDMPPPFDDGSGAGSTAPGLDDSTTGAPGFGDSGNDVPPQAWDDVPVAASTVPSPTPSVTPSETPSTTPTAPPTSSPTPTSKPTESATPTPSSTRSAQPTPSSTGTPTSSVTPSSTLSATPTPSVTQSSGASPSTTPSNTPSNSAQPTMTATATSTGTPTPSSTVSASGTPSITPSTTSKQTMTATPTSTPSRTPSRTPSVSPSVSPSAEPSVMRSSAATPTPSQTPSVTSVPTLTASPTSTISVTPTVSLTSTPTPTSTVSITASPTSTVSITASPTATPSVSLSSTPAPSRKPDPCMGFDCGHGSCTPSASDPFLPECTCTTLRYGKLALTGQCIVDKCENGKFDDGEADVDCGGHCNTLCSAGELCFTNGDCGEDPSAVLGQTRLVCTASYLEVAVPVVALDDVAIVSSSNFVAGSVTEDQRPRCRSSAVEVGVHVETSFVLPGVTLAALSDSVLSTVVAVVQAGVEGAQHVEVVSLKAVEGLDTSVYGSEHGSRIGVSVRFSEADKDMAKANVESYFDSLLVSTSADPGTSASQSAGVPEADLVGSVNAELPADQQVASFAGVEFVQPPVSVSQSVNRCGDEDIACAKASVTPKPTTTPTPSATPSRDPDVTPSASPSEWAGTNNNDDLFGGIAPGGNGSTGDEGSNQTTVIVAAVAATLGVVGIGFLGYKWFNRGSGTAVRGRYRTAATPAGNKRLAAALRRIPMPSANGGGDSMSFSPSSGYDVRQAPSSPSVSSPIGEGLRHAGGANSPMAMLGAGGNSPSATNPMLSHLEMPMRQAPQANMRRGFQPNAANV